MEIRMAAFRSGCFGMQNDLGIYGFRSHSIG